MLPHSITKGDLAVLMAAVVLLLGLYIQYWGTNEQARQAEIIVMGKKQYILDLNQDKRIEVHGKLGVSVIQIKDGKIRFLQSPCTGKQCVRSGWHSHVNALDACLPNEVAIHLVGANPKFDSINF